LAVAPSIARSPIGKDSASPASCPLSDGSLIYDGDCASRQFWERNVSELVFEILSFITGEGGRSTSAGEHKARPDDKQSLLHKAS